MIAGVSKTKDVLLHSATIVHDFRIAGVAELPQGGPDEPTDDLFRIDVARMKRALDAVLAAAAAAVFVACVEFLLMRSRRHRGRIDPCSLVHGTARAVSERGCVEVQ